jgi:hypothetical protein
MWKLTLGYGSSPHPKVGAWPLVWGRREGGRRGLLDEVFVRGCKEGSPGPALTRRPLGIQTGSPQRTLFF